jgi:hypothetical protein
MAVVTTIRFSDFVILSQRSLEWAEIEGVLYATDGVKTWELRQVEGNFSGSKGSA